MTKIPFKLNLKVPKSSDEQEVIETMEDSIFKDLIIYANYFNDINQAIRRKQGELQLMIRANPANIQAIKIAAQKAGQRFLKEVGEQTGMQVVIKTQKSNGPSIMGAEKFGVPSIKQSPPKK